MEDGARRMERFGEVPYTGFARGEEPHVMFLKTVMIGPAVRKASAVVRHGADTLLVSTGEGALEVLRDAVDQEGGVEPLFDQHIERGVLQLAPFPTDFLDHPSLPPGAGPDLLLASSENALSLLVVDPVRRSIRPLETVLLPKAWELTDGAGLWAGPLLDAGEDTATSLGTFMSVSRGGGAIALAGREKLIAILPTALDRLRRREPVPPASPAGSFASGPPVEDSTHQHAREGGGEGAGGGLLGSAEQLVPVEGEFTGTVSASRAGLQKTPNL